MKHLISMQDLTREAILHYLHEAVRLKAKPEPLALQNKLIALCFFEPSTRTRLSFEAATLRSGGHVMGFGDAEQTSIKKGESLSDTIQVISGYADAIILRHPQEGAARLASEVSSIPIVNAGDGANQHPSQTLLDLFTMQENFGSLEGLHVAVMGDLKYGRTVHSLVEALAHFNVRLYFVAPQVLSLPASLMEQLKMKGVRFSFHADLKDVISKIDVLYVTRLQKERLLEKESLPYQGLSAAVLDQAQSHLKILHPLPRQDELPIEIDALPYAHYFAQAKNGLVVRQAILGVLLS